MSDFFDTVESLLRTVSTMCADGEYASLAGYAAIAALSCKIAWPFTRAGCAILAQYATSAYSCLFPGPGRVLLETLALLEDPEAAWDRKSGQLLCEGLLVVIDKDGDVSAAGTGHDYTWDVLPSLKVRERKTLATAVQQAIDRAEERSRLTREEETMTALRTAKAARPAVMDALRTISRNNRGA